MTQRSPPRNLFEAAKRKGEDIARNLAARSRAIGWDDVYEAGLQMDTGMRTAANLMTFGGADHLAAGLDALGQPGGLDHWDERYRANLEGARARNRYDAEHRKIARMTGQVGGAALGMAAAGPMQGVLAAASRLPGAAALTAREMTAMLGAGGAVGVGTQGASDILYRRPSSVGDYLGAATGGIAGVAALPMGPARAGAVGAGATTMAQDLFSGRMPDVGDVTENALLGYVFGGAAGGLGRQRSNALSSAEKGSFGEQLGALRSRINGLTREPGAKKMYPIPGTKTYWYPDGRSGSVRFEDKFGPRATLSANQKLAQKVLGDDFVLYHFLPSDIGKAYSVPAASAAGTWNEDR